MGLQRVLTCSLLAAAAASSLLCAASSAQEMDMAVLARWGNVKQVRYHIVGAYQAQTVIAHQEPAGQADVTDGVVVDLDWNLPEGKLLGKPRIKNAKSVVKNPRNVEPGCPAPAAKGAYEHLTATEVRPGVGQRVELVGSTSFPLIDVTVCAPGPRSRKSVPAAAEPALLYLPIPAPALLAMPAGANGEFVVKADRKSFVVSTGGWTWTYTPSLIP